MDKTDVKADPVCRESALPLRRETAADCRSDVHAERRDKSDLGDRKAAKWRRDKSDLGEHFVAPDGGWAWLVCIAAGVSNLSIYPCLQQFGFLFRQRLAALGLSSSEITTIINTNCAISACTGLLNGPMFRRFTFRQVALAGASFVFTGLLLTAFCGSFVGYVASYSLLYGFGMGVSISASSLAINTYFKVKRRRAAGFSWSITGLGPICLPHVVTLLLPLYGVQGTVLLFASFSLHSMVSALVYQPVQAHVRPPRPTRPMQCSAAIASADHEDTDYLCKYCELQQQQQQQEEEAFGLFSRQYRCQDDDAEQPAYDITDPGTPMMARANDGWFGSKLSLESHVNAARSRRASRARDGDLAAGCPTPNHFGRERDEAAFRARSGSRDSLRLQFGRTDATQQLRCTCAEQLSGGRRPAELPQPLAAANGVGHLGRQRKEAGNNNDDASLLATTDEEATAAARSGGVTCTQKLVAFFDLDLLRDFTYVNLVIGLTIINFGELNFAILTPFILSDFGFDVAQTTLATSVLAGLDITVRFLVPFVTEKMRWDNRVFFLAGVVGIALGRTAVACTRSFPLILGCFAWIGLCKGVRTIFWPLIIPGCVPLKRLPAASGLQLLISGLFTLAAGPLVGLVRDRWNYSVALHCLNAMAFLAAISWTLEALVRRYIRRRRRRQRQRRAAVDGET